MSPLLPNFRLLLVLCVLGLLCQAVAIYATAQGSGSLVAPILAASLQLVAWISILRWYRRTKSSS